MSVVAVFGSSNLKKNLIDYEKAVHLGKLIAQSGYDIVTGGYDGTMEAVLKGADSYPVNKLGVTTEFFSTREKNDFVHEEIKVQTYLQRLTKMIEMADAFIFLPGGTGTLLELAAVWALKERGMFEQKPLICIGEQWSEVIQTMGFYSETVIDKFNLIKHVESIEDAIVHLNNKMNL
ncbi:MAG: LOG family protein [Candidatus Kapabacteria bacterium]|nr:LOG family protein [Candidatus Kapabacteria bacterium]